MEEDIKILENLERDIFKASECSLASSSDKKQWIKEAQAIRNLINKYKEQEETIEKLQSHRQADYMVHEHDVKMIDQVKGECVRLYKENEEHEKIIELMANDLYELYKQYPGTIDKFYEHKICLSDDCDNINRKVNCDCCIREYYEKKARDEND